MITALFEFTRASPGPAPQGASASTYAHAVLVNWSMGQGRSFDPLMDLPHLLVATLTWDESNDATSRSDLESWCGKLGVAVSSALRMSVSPRQEDTELLAPH